MLLDIDMKGCDISLNPSKGDTGTLLILEDKYAAEWLFCSLLLLRLFLEVFGTLVGATILFHFSVTCGSSVICLVNGS